MRYTYGDKMRVEWLCKEARTIFDVLKLEERDDPVFYRLGKFLKSYKLQSYNLDILLYLYNSIYGLEPSSKVPFVCWGYHSLSFLTFEADLEPAEWMKIGCLRQEGEVETSNQGGNLPVMWGWWCWWRWRSPFQLWHKYLPWKLTNVGPLKIDGWLEDVFPGTEMVTFFRGHSLVFQGCISFVGNLRRWSCFFSEILFNMFLRL